MNIISKITQKARNLTRKQAVIAGVFTLAVVFAAGLGLATKQFATAATTIRDNDPINSIDGCSNNGGIGAADAAELIKDIKDASAGNCIGANYKDLATVYADPRFGLTANDATYNKFAAEYKQGVLFRDGHVEVYNDITKVNDTVLTNALTLGRTSMGKPANIRKPVVINGVTYYQGTPENSFAAGRLSLPVMVWFNDDGTVRTVIMDACGNAVEGEKVPSSAECKMLNKTPVAGKKNTYTFTTNAPVTGLAKIVKVEYSVDGKVVKTETNPSTPVELTFTKSADVSVKVFAAFPGGKMKEFVSADCKKHVEVDVPLYTCDALTPSALDTTNRKFRFTVTATGKGGATLKNVDFTLDGKSTVKDVTTKDAKGNIYNDYTFEDAVEHTVSAKVKFVLDGQTVTAPQDCVAKVTPTKKPMCTKPGKENFPPDAPECKDVPLTNTGPGDIFGLFAGASIAGGAAHRLYLRARGRR